MEKKLKMSKREREHDIEDGEIDESSAGSAPKRFRPELSSSFRSASREHSASSSRDDGNSHQ